MSKKNLVIGAVGFVGSALPIRLLECVNSVIDIDNHNDYYDPVLKKVRLACHLDHPNYTHIRSIWRIGIGMGSGAAGYPQIATGGGNLAAQAGVRNFAEWYREFHQIR